ncbi:hypothetical protein CRYUN_Cryun35bG0035200 [Craigia yunnanensis]
MLLLVHSILVLGDNPAQDIFILAGQSNMTGRGGVVDGKWDGNVPPECQPNLSILRLTADLSWEEASDPLHADIDVGRICGVGPGMAFANEIRTHGSGIGMLGLVPCAIGGTSISKWARGSRLYDQLVTRANASVKDGGAIRVLLWYQGESDTGTKETAEAYKGKLEKLIRDLRSDLNLSSLPFIQVALASGEGEFVETVRKAQLEINLPKVKCVDAKGLPYTSPQYLRSRWVSSWLMHFSIPFYICSNQISLTDFPAEKDECLSRYNYEIQLSNIVGNFAAILD